MGCFGVPGKPRRLCRAEGHMECFALRRGAGAALGAVLCAGPYGVPWLAGDATDVVRRGWVCGAPWVALVVHGVP